jgi:hypothetical protein
MDMSERLNSSVESPAYEPPTLVVLGSVAELTLGGGGSWIDNNGKARKDQK